jgi:hypothetical protein
MHIKEGTFYRTREGRSVTIEGVEIHNHYSRYPVWGAVHLLDGGVERCCWTSEGQYFGAVRSAYDLQEVTQG